MPGNRLGLIFDIAAQGTTQAQANAKALGEASESASARIARGMKAQGFSAEEATRAYKSLGIAGTTAARDISAAYGQSAAQMQEGQQGMLQGFYDSIRGLRMFRTAFAATIGLASFGFWFVEWGRVVEGIKNGIGYMEGFGATAQKAYAELVKGADEALVHVGGLTTAQKIAETQALISQTEQRISLDETKRVAIVSESYWTKLGIEIKGVLGLLAAVPFGLAGIYEVIRGKDAPFNRFLKEFKPSDLEADAQKQGVLLQKQLQALTALEKQLREEQDKGAKAAARAAHAQETALHREETAENRLVAAMKRRIASQEQIANWSYAQLHAINRQFAAQQRLGEETRNEEQDFRDRAGGETFRFGQRADQDLQREAVARGKMYWQDLMNKSRAIQRQIKSDNQAMVESYQRMGQQVRQAFDSINQAAEMMGSRHTRLFGLMGTLLEQSIRMERENAKASGAAAVSKTKFAIGAIKQLAPVKAAENIAKALEDLGDFNYYGAAMHFASAAEWGVVGAAQVMSMIGAVGGGGGAGGSGRGAGSRGAAFHHGGRGGSGRGESGDYGSDSGSGQQFSPGGSFPAAPKNGNLTIAIMGETEAGAWLANTLNTAVTQGGAQLAATHTIAVPNPVA